MSYGNWYSDIVKSGKQTVSSAKQSVQQAGQQIVTGAQKAAGQAVQQTAQSAQKAVTGQIQTGTQATLKKIGVQTPPPQAAKPAPAPAPRISVPQVVAQPIKAVTQTVRKNPIPTVLILAAAGLGVWWFFIRKK